MEGIIVFCPKCRDEFIKGITECQDCKVPLVNELSVEKGPAYEPIYVDLVTVMESGDPGLIMVTKSLLEMPVLDIMLKAREFSIYLEEALLERDLIH